MFLVIFRAVRTAVLFFLVLPMAAIAQDVTLTSRDGSVTLGGTLLSFDGEFYRLSTVYGPLVLDGQAVLCSGVGCPDLDAYIAEFTFAGEPALGEVLMPALIEGFAARHGLSLGRAAQDDRHFTFTLSDPATERVVAHIGFRISSTSEGFADMLTGDADIAMAMREIRPDEVVRGIEAGLGDLSEPARSRIVALDALVPIIAPDNPLASVSVEALAAMLSGVVREWDLQDAPIAVHARPADTGMQQAVEDHFLAPLSLVMDEGVIRHASSAALADAVARDPLAIGVSRFSDIGNAVSVNLVGTCGIQLSASRRNLKTEDYPFTAPMFLYTPERRLPRLAREFLGFLTSSTAQRIVRRAGFVDLMREEIALDEQGVRFADAIANAGADVPLEEVQRMVALLRGASRLTPTFRFRGGSTKLDAQSAGNVADLARALESGVFDDRELLFVGFSDSDGNWQVNRRISSLRAEAVRNAVLAAAVTADQSRVGLAIEAFGEAMPMACDDTEWGRSVNRRVEVWLR
ncbi:MAG: cell envelope biogenesis protein OmpA [Confluentimicrobium sp.]|jgi:phosphate transport system substrate-binding protein|nr:cell envelope biogenesis protein OmpA [Actibacterium sp.]|tara:strand:+ start:5263 stop:6819 length:1557 start_codon:yes stop_codon:yes gene_type:complete